MGRGNFCLFHRCNLAAHMRRCHSRRKWPAKTVEVSVIASQCNPVARRGVGTLLTLGLAQTRPCQHVRGTPTRPGCNLLLENPQAESVSSSSLAWTLSASHTRHRRKQPSFGPVQRACDAYQSGPVPSILHFAPPHTQVYSDPWPWSNACVLWWSGKSRGPELCRIQKMPRDRLPRSSPRFAATL
jgi:hypothetical protein